LNCQQPFPDDDPFLPRNHGVDELRQLQQEDDEDALGLVTPGRWPILWWVGVLALAIAAWWGITLAVLAVAGAP